MPGKKKFHFSVIIPTYNRPRLLKGCLRALSKQSYPLDLFEVIIVDDGSGCDLMTVLGDFKSKMHVFLVEQNNKGPAAARNHGTKKASGEILAFTDDDCRPHKNWLKALREKFQSERCAVVGGRTINRLTSNPYSVTSQHIVSAAYKYYNLDPQNAQFFASNNMAVRKELFIPHGGFDPAFRTSEDRELCSFYTSRRLILCYEPEAIIYHIHRLSFLKFYKQHFSYGRGAYRFHCKSGKKSSIKTMGHLKFFITSMKSFLVEHHSRRFTVRVKILGLFFIWQLANLSGFLFQKFDKTPKSELEHKT